MGYCLVVHEPAYYISIMNSFVVFATLLAAACAAPQTLLKTVNEGPQTGPLTPLVGNLVQTPKGLRPIDLEGFSEDLDQDGFVDPVAPAAPAPVVAPVAAPAPVVAAAPAPAVTINAAPIAATPFVKPFLAGPSAVPLAQPTFAAPQFVPQIAAQPAFRFAAPVAAPAPVAPVVRTVAAPAPVALPSPIAPVARTIVHTPSVVKTISPLPVAVRAAPSAVTYDHRSYY